MRRGDRLDDVERPRVQKRAEAVVPGDLLAACYAYPAGIVVSRTVVDVDVTEIVIAGHGSAYVHPKDLLEVVRSAR